MNSLLTRPAMSSPENLKASSSIQVLQVHKTSIPDDDDHVQDGFFVCHASLTRALTQVQTQSKHIDAVIMDSECSMSDILAVKEVTTKELVPLVLHTLQFDWKTRELAIECEVDDYHVGPLDNRLMKRIQLIRKIKLIRSNPGHRSVRHADWKPRLKFVLLKRSFDIAASLLIIAALLPLLVVILPLLVLDTKGPILSSSRRVGMNYKVFNLYKFAYLSSGVDRNITGIWKLLYKMHLVGLPQILNVLRGDLSLVGNYPPLEQDAENFTKDGIAWRFLAPAGIIGLWRLSAQENRTEAFDWTMEDVEYARANSLLLDIKITWYHMLNLLHGAHHKIKKEWMLRHLGLSLITNPEFDHPVGVKS